VAIIQLPDDEGPRILINPEIIRREGERELDEGCLSVPGYRGVAKHSVRVEARALDLNGKVVRIKAEDNLLAQALEHEVDHLNGVLYIDHLADKDSLHKIEEEEEEASR
jgi:peptide deformylase